MFENSLLDKGSPFRSRVVGVLLLFLAFIAFVSTDSWFSILEDETTIVALARQPPLVTLGQFWSGHGQHMHPPLSDLFLHVWIEISGGSKLALRIPSVLLFLAAIFALALSAEKIGGPGSFLPGISIGTFWPFGFHFGRIVGWYAWSFFLVAMLTLSYLQYLEKPDRRRLGLFVTWALLVVFSNYFGWAIVVCLAADIALIRRHPDAKRFLVVTFVTLGLAYLPLWPILLDIVMTSSSVGRGEVSLTSAVFHGLFTLYAVFVSESVAPWDFAISVPASLAILTSIVCLFALLDKAQRPFLGYFAILFGVMIALDIIGTKRVMFITGWLLLSFAVAFGNGSRPITRKVLAIGLVIAAGIGWGGTFSRNHYAAPHFLEPWDDVAARVAQEVKSGSTVVSNSRAFAFSLNYALARLGLVERSAVPGYADTPQVFTYFSTHAWIPDDLRGRPSVLYVRGINIGSENADTSVASWLDANCDRKALLKLVPDPGYELKARFFPRAGQQPYRIQLQRYDCDRQAKAN